MTFKQGDALTAYIEQLRADNGRLRMELNVLLAARDSEIERLRTALHKLQGCDIDNAAQDILIAALTNHAEPKQ